MKITFDELGFSNLFEELYCEYSNSAREEFRSFRHFANIVSHVPCRACEARQARIYFKPTRSAKFHHSGMALLFKSSEGEEITLSVFENKKEVKVSTGILTIYNPNGLFDKYEIELNGNVKTKIESLGMITVHQAKVVHKEVRKLSKQKRSFYDRILLSNLDEPHLGVVLGKDSLSHICRELIQLKPSKTVEIIKDAQLILGAFAHDSKFIYSGDLALNPRYDFVSGLRKKVLLTPFDLQHVYIKREIEVQELDRGFVFSGRNSSNYFHSLIEDLVAFHNIEGQLSQSLPIWLSKETPRAIIEALQILYPNRQFIGIDPKKTYQTKELHLAPRLFEHHDTVLKPWSLGAHIPKDEITHLVKCLKSRVETRQSNVKFRNIYIERKLSTTNLIGRGTRLTFFARRKLRSLGFEFIDPSDMSILEQIRLFDSAQFIIAPTGAALANLIFCSAGTKVYVVLPKCLQDFDIWKALGAISDVSVEYISVNSLFQSSKFSPYNQMHSPMVLSLRDLNGVLTSNIEKFYIKRFQKTSSILKKQVYGGLHNIYRILREKTLLRRSVLFVGLSLINFYSKIARRKD